MEWKIYDSFRSNLCQKIYPNYCFSIRTLSNNLEFIFLWSSFLDGFLNHWSLCLFQNTKTILGKNLCRNLHDIGCILCQCYGKTFTCFSSSNLYCRRSWSKLCSQTLYKINKSIFHWRRPRICIKEEKKGKSSMWNCSSWTRTLGLLFFDLHFTFSFYWGRSILFTKYYSFQ